MGNILFFIVFAGIYGFSAYAKIQQKKKQKELKNSVNQRANGTQQTPMTNKTTTSEKEKTGLFDMLKEIVEEAQAEAKSPASPRNNPKIQTHHQFVEEDDEYYENDDENESEVSSNHILNKINNIQAKNDRYSDKSIKENQDHMSAYQNDTNKYLKNTGEDKGYNSIDNYNYNDEENIGTAIKRKSSASKQSTVKRPSSEKLKEYIVWNEIIGPCKASSRR